MKRVVILVLLVAALLGQPRGRVDNWTHYVRIAGHPLRIDRVDAIVKSATETHVFGIETDNDIPGRYESFLNPTEKLQAIRAVAEKAHSAGNKAFVYIAGLECITAHADRSPHTFVKDHPDWVQRKITGEPAMFGGGTAFWITAGDEDVWISPYALEWRKTYMQRVREIAATGIDGVYVDIPYWMTHFKGWEDSWASFDDATVAAFKAKTGLNARKDLKLGDFSDPHFRRWVDFRMETLTDFMKEIDQNVKSVNPHCITIAEIYPGIESEAVRVGSDVYDLYRVVDVIAHEYVGGGHRAASKRPLDWFHYMAGMYTFRAFAGPKASWMLSYSWDGENNVDRREAMKNLFTAQLMAGTNSWDAKGHVMSESNDLHTRQAVFGWIASHEKTFYRERKPVDPVGVYFSPASRNYFAKEFLDSYLGFMTMLLQAHVEFQVVTPRTLAGYEGRVLILPDARCLSDRELGLIRAYKDAGNRVMATGATGQYDTLGSPRDKNPFAEMLEPGSTRFSYERQCPGKAYWKQLESEFEGPARRGESRRTGFQSMNEQFVRKLGDSLQFTPAVQIDASPFVSAQIARVEGKLHVFLANFGGLKRKASAQQIPERNVRIAFPQSAGTRIFLLPFMEGARELRVEHHGDKLACTIPEVIKGAVVWVQR
jgi:hypothetical protein